MSSKSRADSSLLLRYSFVGPVLLVTEVDQRRGQLHQNKSQPCNRHTHRSTLVPMEKRKESEK